MQTFLPYSSFEESVKCLDYRRLGNQRVEGKGALSSILKRGGWWNHPAVKMWVGYEEALKHYINCCIREWKARGYNNTMPLYSVGELVLPPWLGDDRFHASHRANLLRKNPDFYSKYGWDESPAPGS